MNSRDIDRAREILEWAIADRVFPAAAVDVGTSQDSRWQEEFGALSDAPRAPLTDVDTPFDLASLTKIIATTTVTMELVLTDRIRLEDPVSTFFSAWRSADRDDVTVQDLLEHASGLPARLASAAPSGRAGFEQAICSMRLEYPPRARSVYSDLDFILLGFALADRGGAPLDRLWDEIVDRIRSETGPDILGFKVPYYLSALTAPSLPLPGDLRSGHILTGAVHDDYAAALGGVAGHAGLFGTAKGVGGFARMVLRAARGEIGLPSPFSPDLVRRFVTRSTVPQSSRALGWDTMLLTSSCGTRMSPTAFGHVGFTGTSLWIDPARDRYFVLLTNRVYGGGTLDEMRTVRRAFHDALGEF